MFEILFAHNDADLQEAGVGSLGLEERAGLFLDSGWEREPDLGVVHLLDGSATGVLGGNRLHADDLKRKTEGFKPASCCRLNVLAKTIF